jgi:hypothetical protein
MPTRKNKRPAGRSAQRNPEALERILKVLRTGLPMRFAAAAGNMSPETIYAWRDADPEVERKIEEARLESVQKRWKLILQAGEDKLDQDGELIRAGDWKSIAWSLERTWPEFARPEVQFSITNNTLNQVNHNQLTISAEVADVINRRQKEVESKVEKLFETRRLKGHGNGATKKEQAADAVEVEAERPAAQPPEPLAAVITHKAGDAVRPIFWHQFVTGSGERLVEKDTALFVLKVVVDGALGGGASQRVKLDFADDKVTVGDVLAAIERLSGTLGWQWMVKKAELL